MDILGEKPRWIGYSLSMDVKHAETVKYVKLDSALMDNVTMGKL